jgi:hypothetical protein
MGQTITAYKTSLKSITGRINTVIHNRHNYATVLSVYLSFPQLLMPKQKGYALRSLFPNTELLVISSLEKRRFGQIHLNFLWTHYRTVMRVENPQTRAF